MMRTRGRAHHDASFTAAASLSKSAAQTTDSLSNSVFLLNMVAGRSQMRELRMKLDAYQVDKANLEKALHAAQMDSEQKQRELAAALEAERWRSAAMAQDFAAYKQAQSNRIAYLEVCAIWGSRFRGFRVQGLL